MSTDAETADLVAFLRARYDEAEQAALATLDANVRVALRRGEPVPRWELTADGGIRDTGGTLRVQFTWATEAAHITRWDPAHVLADIESKRRILALHQKGEYGECVVCDVGAQSCGCVGHQYWPCATLRLLAAPYAGRADFPEVGTP